MFAGSLRSGKRVAALISLIQSARINGHDPYAYLKYVFTRLTINLAAMLDRYHATRIVKIPGPQLSL